MSLFRNLDWVDWKYACVFVVKSQVKNQLYDVCAGLFKRSIYSEGYFELHSLSQ